jgi:hypothetical protein
LGVVAVSPPASVTTTLKEKEPAAVGVPLMTPVPAFSDRPGGAVPENVYT